MKAKKIAKRLRARARQLQLEGSFQNEGQVSVDRVGLLAEVLQEVADQLAPRPKKTLKKLMKAKKATKKAKEAKAPTPSTNGSTHEPQAGIGG